MDDAGEFKTEQQLEVEKSSDAIKEVHKQDDTSIEAGAPTETTESKLAGKYESFEDLQKGTKHALKHLGMEENYYDDITDPAKLEELYQNLDRIISQGENPEIKPEEQATDLEIDSKLEKSGLSMDDLTKEYSENNNTLTPESREKIKEAFGIDDNEINDYISWKEGAQDRADSVQQSYEKSVVDSIGGEQEYQKLISWAKDNYTPEQTLAFDEAVNSGNLESAKLAVEALQGRHVRAEGSNPNLLQGQQATQSTDVYRSDNEMMKEMGTSLYKDSITERQRVKEKVERSMAIGALT